MFKVLLILLCYVWLQDWAEENEGSSLLATLYKALDEVWLHEQKVIT